MNTLSELPARLRQAVLLIQEKTGRGTTYEDAETLARYAGLRPDPLREGNDYDMFIRERVA